MAPHNRIWGLNDIGQDNAENLLNHNNINNERKPNPLEAAYCQPISSSSSVTNSSPQKQNIKLCGIKNLNHDDRCSSTLQRILDEFYPIIQRRNFNVLSISELCCCGDGLDYDRGSKRKLRKQSSNVWGYNCTKFLGRGKKSHTIHLRLRNPRDHNQLLDWEDVAGTMAHELSHCVHQNHDGRFFKLMEEILEEHATLQAQNQVQNLSSTGGIDFDNNNPTKTATTDDHSIRTSGGHRLGGDGANGSNKGRSRLLWDNNNSSAAGAALVGGYRLGGSSSSKNTNPNSIREVMAQAAMARAAATRGRFIDRTRRMMERAKEPCVIEILDDDGGDDDDDIDTDHRTTTRPKQQQQQQHQQDQKPKAKRKTSRAVGEPKRIKMKTELIDLTTTDTTTTTTTTRTTSSRQKRNNNPDDGSAGGIRFEDREEVAAVEINPSSSWVCSLCTYRNRPLALVCDVCLSQR